MSKTETENYQAKAAFNDLDTIKNMIGIEMDYVDAEANADTSYFDDKEKVKRWKNLEETYDRICDLMDVVNVEENDSCCSDDSDECENC
tara:strand:- start:196 stop:462 length:267 start_codon:yes stop_codon:yes gene_type:complete